LCGIAWVVSERAEGAEEEEVVDPTGDVIAANIVAATPASPPAARPKGDADVAATGIVLGILAAAGQGVGLVLTKIGASGAHYYDPFATTQIRALAGIIVFAMLVILVRRSRDVIRAVRNPAAMG